MTQISVVVPTLDEGSVIEPTLRTILERRAEADIEVIVADGGSHDRTIAIAERFGRVVSAERGKARQLNAGARAAAGDVLFFVHADMEIPPGALAELRRVIEQEGYDGGGFSNVFARHNDRIKQLGRVMNLRLRDNDHARNTVFFGDNGIFVRRAVFEALGGFKDIPIMEDYEFSTRLRSRYRVIRIQSPRLVVSPRRHERAGFVRTRLQWILVKRLFMLGVPPRLLARLYRDVR